MRIFGVVIAMCLALVLAAAPASASGPYVGGQAGVVFLSDADISDPSGLTATAEFDTGFGLGLVGGYDFDMFRLEGELFYKTNGIDQITLGLSAPADGDFTTLGLMVNAYYDFRTATPVTPYIGAGLGMAQVSAEDVTVGGTLVADDDDMVFSYQLIAGIGYAVSNAVTLDLAYKYLGTADPSLTDVDGAPFDTEYNSHNVVLGLRYKF